MSEEQVGQSVNPGVAKGCKGCAIAIGASLTLILVVGILGRQHPVTSSDEPKKAIEKLLGKKDNMGGARVRDGETGWSNGWLVVAYNADENLTPGMTRTGCLMDIEELIAPLLAAYESANGVQVKAYLALTDPRGHTEHGLVMRADFSRGNSASINWENVLMDNIPSLAEVYWEHPALSK